MRWEEESLKSVKMILMLQGSGGGRGRRLIPIPHGGRKGPSHRKRVLPFIVQSHSLILLEAKAIAAITSAMKMLLALELPGHFDLERELCDLDLGLPGREKDVEQKEIIQCLGLSGDNEVNVFTLS